MTELRLRIATRGSDLALWQAERVAALLRVATPGLEVELITVSTSGDRRLDVPIAELGGKGVFAKEVQAAVLDGRADLAVHSAKDLPAVTIDGLALAAVPERGDARDALAGAKLADLAPGATVGTGSARRRVQLAALRPDLTYVGLRGNMARRLSRLDDLDAVVVAAVALERLGLADRIAEIFDVETVVPQVGQGALAVECRADDEPTMRLVEKIEDAPSRRRVDAERAFLARLGGDCTLPAGAHAVSDRDGAIRLLGILASEDESRRCRQEVVIAPADDECAAGAELADRLRADLC